MKLPQNAIIAPAKLTEYLLKPKPFDDKSAFLLRAGYSRENWQQLEVDLRQQILTRDAMFIEENIFGRKYQIIGILTGRNNIELNIVTIWMFELATQNFKFITLFPNKEKNREI
ncbi:hypothetical protein POG22_06985 [Geitlerinema sp. CS-897]|nr:hypothetical protein [Geitlerinema sp. CS-897]